MAADKYKCLTRRERQAYTAGELPDEWLEAIKHSEMDSRHNHLNALFEDEHNTSRRPKHGYHTNSLND